MKDDFQDFIESSKSPSPQLDSEVTNFIRQDLNPEHKTVFFKLTIVHGFIGLITMVFCPQFNFSLTNNYDVFHYFHRNFGHAVCMIICGSIFLGSGAVFASHILKQSELKKIRQSRFLYFTSLSILAVSVFFLFGAEIYLNLVGFWMVGAIFGSILLFESNLYLKRKLIV